LDRQIAGYDRDIANLEKSTTSELVKQVDHQTRLSKEILAAQALKEKQQSLKGKADELAHELKPRSMQSKVQSPRSSTSGRKKIKELLDAYMITEARHNNSEKKTQRSLVRNKKSLMRKSPKRISKSRKKN